MDQDSQGYAVKPCLETPHPFPQQGKKKGEQKEKVALSSTCEGKEQDDHES